MDLNIEITQFVYIIVEMMRLTSNRESRNWNIPIDVNLRIPQLKWHDWRQIIDFIVETTISIKHNL